MLSRLLRLHLQSRADATKTCHVTHLWRQLDKNVKRFTMKDPTLVTVHKGLVDMCPPSAACCLVARHVVCVENLPNAITSVELILLSDPRIDTEVYTASRG